MSVFRPNLFAGKVALVTGGGTGIGKAISEELLSLGCKVAIASRNYDRLKEAASELSKIGTCEPFKCNIRKEDEVKSTVAEILEKHNKIDFLVNNGGGQFLSEARSIKLKGWNAVIETNLTGTFLVTKEVVNQHFHDNGGCIVNIIAEMFRGFPMMSHTGAARAAVENLTKSWAVEWAGDGIRVNSVAPGVIFSSTAKDNYDINVFEAASPTLPAKRVGNVQEVSSAVCFLLSPGAQYISGATLRVDHASSLYSPHIWNIPDHEKTPPYTWDPYKTEK